jgi:exonuclease SbcC
MRIDEVELQNIGPHEKLQVEFQSGLIGLIGPNGAGKSTLVNSVYAALTNDFTRFSNVKSDIITNNSKGPSYIRIRGSHHSQNFELTRWLRPNKNELIIDGSVWTKANDVNDQVQARLGISKLVIDKYVFVDQWAMFQFLSQTDSERAKTFQYLCGTEVATKIHKACTDFVSKQQGVEVVDNSLELEESIAAVQKHVDHHREKGREAKRLMLSEEQLTYYQDIVDAAEKAKEAASTLAGNKQGLDDSVKQRNRLKKLRKQRMVQLAEAEVKLKSFSEDEMATAKDIVENWDKYKDVNSTIAQLERGIEKLSKAAEENESKKPAKDSRYIELDCRDEQLKLKGELEFQQQQDEDFVSEFSGGSHKCSKCLQSVSEEYAASTVKAYEARAEQLRSVTRNLNLSTRYDTELKAYESARRSLTEAMEALQAELDETYLLREKAPDPGAYDEASQRLRDFKQADWDVVDTRSAISRLEVTISRLSGSISNAEDYISQLQEKVDAAPDPEKLKEAVDAINQDEDASVSYKVAVKCFDEAKENRDRIRKTLKQLKLRLQEKSKIRKLLATVAEAGDVFHWNHLPKTVSQANLELLVDDINANLTLFSNPFYVEADQDLTFKVFFPGKSPVKAKQLSGGQKVVLAIAFRAALDRVFGHDVGMLYLDEPTAGLDADNVAYFHESLQQLAEKVHGDRQLIVITHVQELGGVFDQLIEI